MNILLLGLTIVFLYLLTRTKYVKEYMLYLGVLRLIKKTPLILRSELKLIIKNTAINTLVDRLTKKGYTTITSSVPNVPEYSFLKFIFIQG